VAEFWHPTRSHEVDDLFGTHMVLRYQAGRQWCYEIMTVPGVAIVCGCAVRMVGRWKLVARFVDGSTRPLVG
jgi:hypothetical protein